jgi:hypothetical protein
MEESKKTKGHAEDCQNRLRPPMSEESKINKGPEEDSQNRLTILCMPLGFLALLHQTIGGISRFYLSSSGPLVFLLFSLRHR